jgi:hypothetical protein
MSGNPALYPVPARPAGRRISPTVISQYVRLDQCRRYLRLALHERASGPDFLRDYGVAAQGILPLLTRSGAEFEEGVEAATAQHCPTRNLASEQTSARRIPNNDDLLAAAGNLDQGEVLVLFQVRLNVSVGGWDMTGDADLIRMERGEDGQLDLLVADMKATTTEKIEHRLQVAFYREMLRTLFANASVPVREVAIGILYRGAANGDEPADEEERKRLERERAAAERLFGVSNAYLDVIANADAYDDEVRALVTGSDSVADQVSAQPFADIPWHLTYKCDGCLYNEFCMKWAAQNDDLSLLPHLTEHEKAGLLRAGVATTHDLATLLEPAKSADSAEDLKTLRPAAGREPEAERIAKTWPVGPRMEELVHRARRYRKNQGDVISALNYIPSKGYGSLPFSSPEQNPNLVRVYIDAQHDYLNDRIYLIGALVTGNAHGEPDPKRRRSVVEMTPEPPDEASERELLVNWIEATIRAVVEVAAPDENGEPAAPIHLIFFNSFEQRLLLDALSRHAQSILSATPLYDFVTQIAAFDSSLVTFLDRDIREQKNYPMVCQSLQALAGTAWPGGERFDWNTPEPFREIFRERLFDAMGRFDPPRADGERQPWATRRSRFNSQLPLEYATSAWGNLPQPEPGEKDPYEAYRRATRELIIAFQSRRLEALEHVAKDFMGNRDTTKTNFRLPDLVSFNGKAGGLAEALQEFLTLERHVALAGWKSARLPPPERRVLAGNTLVARFLEEDQLPEVAEALRENARREPLRAAAREAFFEANPGKKQAKLALEVKAATDPVPIPGHYRFRLDTTDTGVTLDDVLALTTIKDGERLVVEPRWTVDSRLPEAEQRPLQSTPKQLLRGMRQTLKGIVKDQGSDGRVVRAWLLTEDVLFSMNSDNPPGYLFSSFKEPLVDGERYTFDSDPNDIYGFWQAKVVQGLLAGGENELFRRVQPGAEAAVHWPVAAAEAQARFMAGLEAMHRVGATHSFEASKTAYIGVHGDAPLMLVQGPPGTGKSFTTAYAILSRVQGALAAGIPYRVALGAKTHAATNVLLTNVIDAIVALGTMRATQPTLFAEYFDARLLNVPRYRLNVRDGEQPEGSIALQIGAGDHPKPLQFLAGLSTAIVGSTPGGIYRAAKEQGKDLFNHPTFELLVLDEASQVSLPEAIMAALPLRASGQVIVVGDHRQMAPIVQHDWENEARRTFQDYAVYRSLFETVKACDPVEIKFQQTFRLHRDMAEFLRRSIYTLDGLHYFSEKDQLLPLSTQADPFVAAVLNSEHPIVVVTHDEKSSQVRNDFERALTTPLLEALFAEGYSVSHGFGMVVPHRAQRASLQEALRAVATDPNDADIATAVDTVERFQGGERQAIIVSATESDPAYLLASGKFLYDPRRLTVAISRAKEKLVVVASRSVFETFSPDEQTFLNAQLWKDLLHRTCTELLWSGARHGHQVQVWGNPPLVAPKRIQPLLNVNMATSGISSVPPAAR